LLITLGKCHNPSALLRVAASINFGQACQNISSLRVPPRNPSTVGIAADEAEEGREMNDKIDDAIAQLQAGEGTEFTSAFVAAIHMDVSIIVNIK